MALIDLLGVIQEEASEIIKEVSKVRRSGENFIPFADRGKTATNRDNLETEILDLLALLEIWREWHDGPDFRNRVAEHLPGKITSLRRWSPEVFEHD